MNITQVIMSEPKWWQSSVVTLIFDWPSDLKIYRYSMDLCQTSLKRPKGPYKVHVNTICIHCWSNGPQKTNKVKTRHVLTGQTPPQQQQLCHGQQISEVSSPSNLTVRVMARIRISGMCALWPWPWRYDLGSHTLEIWTTISRSNMAMRSYGPDRDFGYVCTVTLTLEIWHRVKVMTRPWVMDNMCVKYYPNSTWQWGVMAGTQIFGMCALWPWPWGYDLGSRS